MVELVDADVFAPGVVAVGGDGDGGHALIAGVARGAAVGARGGGWLRRVGIVRGVVWLEIVLVVVEYADAANITRSEGAVPEVGIVGIFVLLVSVRGPRVELGLPAVASVEYVLDALVSRELVGLTAPGGGEGATVEVLKLSSIARLGDAGDGYEVSVKYEKGTWEMGLGTYGRLHPQSTRP